MAFNLNTPFIVVSNLSQQASFGYLQFCSTRATCSTNFVQLVTQ